MPDLISFELIFAAEAFELWAFSLAVRLGGYQPHYFPRLHCLARMLDSDISPIADYVQYVRKHAYPGPDGTRVNGPSYQAQTPVKTRDGVLLLGVPVSHAGQRQRINEARVSYDTPWYEKHLNVLEQNYRPAAQFDRVFPEVRTLLARRYDTLADLAMATAAWSLAFLFDMPDRERTTIETVDARLPLGGARVQRILAISGTSVPAPDKESGRDANDWIIDMCRHFGADEYYFGGTSASAYMDFSKFRNAGIALKQQEWKCIAYPQQYGDFAPNLSILDLLMNVTPAEARAVLHVRDA